jgi:hypothetical protein
MNPRVELLQLAGPQCGERECARRERERARAASECAAREGGTARERERERERAARPDRERAAQEERSAAREIGDGGTSGRGERSRDLARLSRTSAERSRTMSCSRTFPTRVPVGAGSLSFPATFCGHVMCVEASRDHVVPSDGARPAGTPGSRRPGIMPFSNIPYAPGVVTCSPLPRHSLVPTLSLPFNLARSPSLISLSRSRPLLSVWPMPLSLYPPSPVCSLLLRVLSPRALSFAGLFSRRARSLSPRCGPASCSSSTRGFRVLGYMVRLPFFSSKYVLST